MKLPKKGIIEAGCTIPFTRREFFIMALIAMTALSDAEDEELIALHEKLTETLDV